MDFKKRKIGKGPLSSEKPAPKPHLIAPHLKVQILTLIGGITFVFILLFMIFQLVKSLDFSSIIFSFGKSLQTDHNGKTNILLVGIGGEGHDGPYLTDTIIVAGIDDKNKLVSMLSIPRDLFIETKQTGRTRINEVLYQGMTKYGKSEGMTILKDTVSQLTDLDIQYYARIDFDGFIKIVNSLGGLDVNVESDIYDPEFPKGETTQFETFSLKKGLQHLDGLTALKFARSRHGTSGGNVGRAGRQQQLLFALKEKALSLNILTNPGKIQEIYNSVADSIETNLSLAEIIELGKLSKDMDKNAAVPLVITDDPAACAGLVYTPAREYFGGASVLLPAGGNYDHLHLFVDTVFNNIKEIKDSANDKIQILNGTKVAGMAYEGMALLSRFCLNVAYYSNADNRDLEESTIYYKPDANGNPPAAMGIISKLMPDIKTVPGIPASYLASDKRSDSSIVIELGKDYLTKRIKDPFDSLKYVSVPSSAKTQTQQSQAANN
jgi:polyisoprenyl-teichoic acid--peptidoglycan teichoic acid transferase